MQNSVEFLSNEQRYKMIKVKNRKYQTRIRKSSNKLAEWEEVLKNSFERK